MFYLWINCIYIFTYLPLFQDLYVYQTKFCLALWMILTLMVFQLNVTLSFIHLIYIWTITLITKPTCWVILTWPWHLYDLDWEGHIFSIMLLIIFLFSFIYGFNLYLERNNTCEITDMLDDLDFYMALTNNYDRFLNFALIIFIHLLI